MPPQKGMNMNEFCQMESCHRKAKFSIHRIKTEEWLDVCGIHDNFIGMQNLISLGHSKGDAQRITKEVKKYG